MQKILDVIFSEDLVPHGYCFSWRAELIWLHAISDIVIALAYFAIPITIFIICKKRKKGLPFAWVFRRFIKSCHRSCITSHSYCHVPFDSGFDSEIRGFRKVERVSLRSVFLSA